MANIKQNGLQVGLIGLGHWGPNYLRIFSQLPNTRVLACAEKKPANMHAARQMFPAVTLYTDYHELLKDPAIDAVIVATPSSLHYAMTREALLAGKHVLVEKPLCLTSRDAKDLGALAHSCGRVLMVGHTFLFNGGVQVLKKYIRSGQMGSIHYLNAVRTNLGPIRDDVNALTDLAPHDISILLDLLGRMPLAVTAHGAAYIKKKREDVVFMNLFFPGNVMANVHVSWMEPCKVRQITAIGSRKMAVFDDINTSEMIKIYDKGVIRPKRYSSFGEFQLILRDGDVFIPKVQLSEPLKNECIHFVEAVAGKVRLRSDAAMGLQVVQVLEAAQQSLRSGGKTISLS